MCYFQKHQIEGKSDAENNCSMIIHMGNIYCKRLPYVKDTYGLEVERYKWQ